MPFMEKFNTFLDLFKTNLIIEYNKNQLITSRIEPYGRIYYYVCTGDRIINYYLDKIPTNPNTSLDKGIKHTLTPLKTTKLPSLYSFGIRKLILNSISKLKNIFYNRKSYLKFYTEDILIPNLYNKESYTEEGVKNLYLFQTEHPKSSLKDIRKIEYIGNNEFVFEIDCNKLALVKLKVVDQEGIKIDELTFSDI